jgi:hypothetical protein
MQALFGIDAKFRYVLEKRQESGAKPIEKQAEDFQPA